MEVRRAGPGELTAVMSVLDAGFLEATVDEVRSALEAGRVLVAVEGVRVLGTVVLDAEVPTDGARIEAVAVRPARRGQGLGTALVTAASDEYGRLTAEFDGNVRPFWSSLGFEVEPSSVPGRYVGLLTENPSEG